jgi:alpha-N-arabinofuranosidase
VRNWAQFFRKYDDDLTLLGIGSPAANDPAWDVEVLQTSGDLIDFLTLHIYGHSFMDDADDYHATVNFPVYVEDRLRRMIGVIESAGYGAESSHPIRISIDEWNIRHMTRNPESGEPLLHRGSPRTMQDALAAAGVFHVMARHARHVRMANYVFLLNGNGVLLVNPDGIVRTPLFHLFSLYRRCLLPTVLDARVESPVSDTPVREAVQDDVKSASVPYVDVIATIDQDAANMTVAIVNRHQIEDAEVSMVSPSLAGTDSATMTSLSHADPRVRNDVQSPDMIGPVSTIEPWAGTVRVKPQSVTIVQVRLATG